MEIGNLIVKQQELFEVSRQKNYNSSKGILRVNMEVAEIIFLCEKEKEIRKRNENKFYFPFLKAVLCC